MEREYRPRLRTLVHENAQPKVDPSEMRKFGFPVGLVLVGIAALSFWRDHIFVARLFGGVGALLVMLAATRPTALRPFHWAWMKFAHALGWFNTRLLLGLVFYLVITPVAIFLRLTGKRPLALKWDKEAETYWLPREKKEFDPARCEKHF